MPKIKDPAALSVYNDRTARIVAMHKQGVSLEKIGQQFKVTRERIRQILKKNGLDSSTGGMKRNFAMKREVQQERKEQARIARNAAMYGLPFEVVDQLRKDGVLKAFREQRRNAAYRGIEWKLDFKYWFSIWQASGKLHLRGRGHGKYVMSRIRDDGPYELGNVHIQLADENNREAVEKWRGQFKENPGVFCLYPGYQRPWMAQVSGKSIGLFATEEEAVEARAKTLAERGQTAGGFGRGRGWTYVAKNKNKPYLMQCAGVTCKAFATQAEAEAAYRAAVEARVVARKQVCESTKCGGVNVFHGSYFSASKPLNATQLNGEVL